VKTTGTTGPMRVAYSVEQCWHDAPGGTAISALRIARELRSSPEFVGAVELLQVAGKHPLPPHPTYRPVGSVAMLPLGRPLLYESWTRLNWPKVESVTGRVDVVHATGLIPCATSLPLVVTVHDLAFLQAPAMFTKHGVKSMTRALSAIRRRANRIIVSSSATRADCIEYGFPEDRLRLVPLGVDAAPATAGEVADAIERHDLPSEFVLFVGTLEPRKNLVRLVAALSVLVGQSRSIPLVIVGADGWGDVSTNVAEEAQRGKVDARFLGHVSNADLRGIYASATVFAYPSEREGFGLPVAEAMAQGAAVVTSQGTSTEEVAGGAAVLVDPFDVDDIARGLCEALDRREELSVQAKLRASELSWAHCAQATLDVYRELTS
jgi:glycosyltransferase involved in cell wall biosynthesis